MSAHIHHGFWINWSHGLIVGATVTLGEREGGLLTAFVATFVTIVGAELWKIICYISHQVRSKNAPQDGLYHQQQVILRTSPTPGGAAWLFFQQTWCWAGRARLSLLRTLPWALFGAIYIGAVGLIAIFSSEISKSPGPLRLIVSDDCGLWMLNMSSPYHQEAFQVKSTNDSLTAATYAKACYGGSGDPLSCSKFPVPSISWTSDQNATCPFESGTCIYGDTAAFRMVSKRINSHFDLGINAPSAGRIEVEKTTTCAPVRTRSFAKALNSSDPGFYGRPDDTIAEYYYGPVVGVANYTYAYNDHAAFDNNGYTLTALSASAGTVEETGAFDPVPALNTTDADLSLLFIAANSVYYSEPCGDPVFSANTYYSSNQSGILLEGYYPDYWVSVLGCSEQYRICNPNTNQCTPGQGLMQLKRAFDADEGGLDMNDVQNAVATRLFTALQVSNVYYATFTRLGAALRASETLSTLSQRYLPPNQWHIEVGSWFDAGLARLQQRMQEYATGPANVPRGSYVLAPDPSLLVDIPYRAMCYSQLVNDSSDTMSFSVLGMGILFGVGAMIIFTSLTIDTIVGWIQLKLGKGLHARTEWLVNDKLEMQRLLFEEVKLGQWDDSKRLPVTFKGQSFIGVADRHLNGMLKGQADHEDGATAELVEEHFDSKA